MKMIQRKLVLEHFGFDGIHSGLSANELAQKYEERDSDEAKLSPEKANSFREAIPDTEICPEVSCPRGRSAERLKKLVRYLIDRPGAVFQYIWQEEDSDWGSYRRTRSSTSGGILMLGEHCIKTWASTQGSVARISAEAEN